QGVSATRLVLYKPHYALIVIDSARSKKPHSYQRYFQLGPDVRATRNGDAVKLDGKHGFEGELSSTGTASSKVSLLRGQQDPVRGWLFPHYRTKVARTTVEFTD